MRVRGTLISTASISTNRMVSSSTFPPCEFLQSQASGVYTVQGFFVVPYTFKPSCSPNHNPTTTELCYAAQVNTKLNNTESSHTLAISFSLLIYDQFSLCFHPISSILSCHISPNLLSPLPRGVLPSQDVMQTAKSKEALTAICSKKPRPTAKDLGLFSAFSRFVHSKQRHFIPCLRPLIF